MRSVGQLVYDRFVRWSLLIALVASVGARSANAGTPEELVAEGKELATAGELSRAILKFKEADASQPTAEHACLIGLAYTRRELWSQAEIFFALCKRRSTSGDALPEWTDEAVTLLQTKLAAPELGLAPIEIRVEPAVPETRVNVAGFPADEAFPPQTIHLGAGTYELTATAPGRADTRARVTVTNNAPQVVTLTLPEPPAKTPPPPPPPPPRMWSTKLWIGSGIAAAVGVGLHLWASNVRSTLQDARDHGDAARWDKHATKFQVLRGTAIGAYGLAAIGLAFAVVTHRRESERAPSVTTNIDEDGVFVGVSWQR
jgi:hypothetical protein